jgi:hypothetical protein
MEDREPHWFATLRQITGANPIPKEAAGDVPQMIAAWLGWAKGHGY